MHLIVNGGAVVPQSLWLLGFYYIECVCVCVSYKQKHYNISVVLHINGDGGTVREKVKRLLGSG